MERTLINFQYWKRIQHVKALYLSIYVQSDDVKPPEKIIFGIQLNV